MKQPMENLRDKVSAAVGGAMPIASDAQRISAEKAQTRPLRTILNMEGKQQDKAMTAIYNRIQGRDAYIKTLEGKPPKEKAEAIRQYDETTNQMMKLAGMTKEQIKEVGAYQAGSAKGGGGSQVSNVEYGNGGGGGGGGGGAVTEPAPSRV